MQNFKAHEVVYITTDYNCSWTMPLFVVPNQIDH
jgi:hypothetical protein